MRVNVFASVLVVGVLGCGAAPNQPLLANAPHPDPAAVAGVAAGVAAAATLADPDASTRGRPEKRDEAPKKPIMVKESVPADVLDRQPASTAQTENENAPQPNGPDNPIKERPDDALDFGALHLPPGTKAKAKPVSKKPGAGQASSRPDN